MDANATNATALPLLAADEAASPVAFIAFLLVVLVGLPLLFCADAKRKIFKETGVHPNHQRLLHGAEELSDERTVEDWVERLPPPATEAESESCPSIFLQSTFDASAQSF